MPAPPPSPHADPRLGWVMSYEVTPDREIIMTCFDPVTRQETRIGVKRMELESMLLARPVAPRRRGGERHNHERSA